MSEDMSVLREIDAEAIKVARTLLRTSRQGSLAVLNAETDVLASAASAFPPIWTARRSSSRPSSRRTRPPSLRTGAAPCCWESRGRNPLAHARISIDCNAREVDRESSEHARVRARYLSHQPKAMLYADLGDFRFFRFESTSPASTVVWARLTR